VEKDTGGDQQQALTIRNNKIMYLERMLSLAEEDKKKQEIIIMKMTYNEELRKKACSVLEQKNVKLESSTNYLKSVCVERDENISNMQGEIDIKNVEMRRLHDEIDVTTYDLKQLREKNSALHKRVSELQYQIEEYEKKKEESKLVTQLPNAGITPTETRETTPPTRAAPNRRLVCFCAQSTSEAVWSIPLQSSYLAAIFNYLYEHFKANVFVLKNQKQ
jgi:chromosome segregation ATPase